jgi:hypothetical protein
MSAPVSRAQELVARVGVAIAAVGAVYLLAAQQNDLAATRDQLAYQTDPAVPGSLAAQLRDAQADRDGLAAQLASVRADLVRSRRQIAGVAQDVTALPKHLPRPVVVSPSPGRDGSTGPQGPAGPAGPSGTSPDAQRVPSFPPRPVPTPSSEPPICLLPKVIPCR